MKAIHMADRLDRTPFPSRRMWLAGLGGGLLSVPFLAWFEIRRPPRADADTRQLGVPCCSYVDRDGWMLTPEDAAALASRPTTQ